MSFVCITGRETNVDELRQRLEKVMALPYPLRAELRLDYLKLSPEENLKFLRSLPKKWAPKLLLVQRLQVSGPLAQGHCTWSIPVWQNWWTEVAKIAPWFAVDLDWLVIDELSGETISWPQNFGANKVFFSLHAKLNELESCIDELVASAALYRVGVKLAAPVHGARDLARLLRLRQRTQRLPYATTIAMGQAGRPWRWSPLVGSVSYFAASAQTRTALGQDVLEDVLPYLETRSFPSLYLLWSTDPLNLRGESEWNRVLAARGIKARYFNLACDSEDFHPGLPEGEKKQWAKDALVWMRAAGVRGASVTRPFKEVFPLVSDEPKSLRSINTILLKRDRPLASANTDATAVLSLLQERGLHRAVLLGSGGTAQGLKEVFAKKNFPIFLWKREDDGHLPLLPAEWQEDTLVSTWPAEYQTALVKELRHQTLRPPLCIDAQLKLGPEESPLALWCAEKNFPYLPGELWWRRQAEGQARFWLESTHAAKGRKQFLLSIKESSAEIWPYLEILLRTANWNLQLPWAGGVAFPQLLQELSEGMESFDLSRSPDLAPALWAAAILWKKKIRIEGKARAKLLVDVARLLKLNASLEELGFSLDATSFAVPLLSVSLPTGNDASMAMAIGLLEFFHPIIQAHGTLPSSYGDVLKKMRQSVL